MTTDTAPRPEKVAIVEEITEKLNNSVAVFVTEYRGMSVGDLANLRAPLREAGAEHKVYKNTLARLAAHVAGSRLARRAPDRPDRTHVRHRRFGGGREGARDFQDQPAARHPGRRVGRQPDDRRRRQGPRQPALREELLARLAGAFQAPLVKTAGLLQALPRNFAYGLSPSSRSSRPTAAA